MAVNPGYTRRQELRCTLDALSTYSGVILYEGEVLYVKQANGSYAIKIGDGETNIANLPYVVNYSDISTKASNAATSATAAAGSATAASGSAQTAEAYAKGTKNGTDVPATDPAYHNNAKYYAEQAADNAEAAAEEVLNSKAEAVALALAYDNTVAYKVGNLLTYLGKQYYCIADAPAGTLPTNTTYFEEKSVADIIEMIKNGSIVTGHSEVADNLTPYSEDSGTTQENPFISQGTGTDNNSVIVTTGAIARQLEKQGNTVGKNQQCPNGVGSSDNGTATYDSTNDLFNIVPTTSTKGYACAEVVKNYNFVDGHVYLTILKCVEKSANVNKVIWKISGNNAPYVSEATVINKEYFWVTTYTTFSTKHQIVISNGGSETLLTTSDYAKVKLKLVDLTQWGFSSDIITDLTSHPEHFSWYYNGSLAYDAGSLQNCNGRYLECGQGRNLFGGTMELGKSWSSNGQYVATTNNFIATSYKAPVVPNTKYAITCINLTTNNLPLYIVEFDSNKNFIRRTEDPLYMPTASKYRSFTVGANTWFIAFQFYKDPAFTSLAEVTPIDLSKYYTPEEGGEGYNQHYDYVAPIRIDTGNETLKAFDKKLPSGVIERNTGEVDLGTLTWSYIKSYAVFTANLPTMKKYDSATGGTDFIKCAKYITSPISSSVNAPDKSIYPRLNGQIAGLGVKDSAYTDAETFKTAMSGVMLQYEFADASKTTEQGTPFSEYAPINDYSYMAWFDNDGNLVSIPQGCKLFYPVDYKGFTDDLVMYTNGDATALAKNEDITDTALNARGYYKMQDLLTLFSKTMGGSLAQTLALINTDIDPTECNYVDLGSLTWYRSADYANPFFFAAMPSDAYKNTTLLDDTKVIGLSPKYQWYKAVGGNANYWNNITNKAILFVGTGFSSSNNVYIRDDSFTTAADFKSAMSGVLLAYEKATT